MTKKDQKTDEAVHDLVSALLDGLTTMSFMRKTLRPSMLAQLGLMSLDKKNQLTDHLDALKRLKVSRLGAKSTAVLRVKSKLEIAGNLLNEAFGFFATGGEQRDLASGISMALSGLKCATGCIETLFALTADLPEVNRFFISPGFRNDAEVLCRAQEATTNNQETGLYHKQKSNRGGYSVYVPEYYSDQTPWPLIVALHPGDDDGGDFIWHWLREARTFGAILVTPTSMDRTWSLAGHDLDSSNINRIIAEVTSKWRVNRFKSLLTGTSDGGTFCYLAGLKKNAPFSHLAPCSANFHSKLVEVAPHARLVNLPVYLVHGCQDWVFPTSISRHAKTVLSVAGAQVIYHEIPNLGHAHPEEENVRIMDWFLHTKNAKKATA